MDGRNRSGVLLNIIDSPIAAGARLGEVLAIRTGKLNICSAIPSVQIGFIIRINGQGFIIQENTQSNVIRRMALLQLVVDHFTRVLQERRPKEWDVVSISAAVTLMDTRKLGHARTKTLAKSEFAWVTPRTLRKTVATLIDAEHCGEKAARQPGHLLAKYRRSTTSNRPRQLSASGKPCLSSPVDSHPRNR